MVDLSGCGSGFPGLLSFLGEVNGEHYEVKFMGDSGGAHAGARMYV